MQRAVELGCILAAAVLLACHAIRLAVTLGRVCWWQVLAVAAGVLSADLVSGMVHWTADTWGNETMPLLGRRFIRPFRVHHVNPDDFLQRDIIDTGDVSMLVLLPLLAAFRIPLDGAGGVPVVTYVVAFAAAGSLANQAHRWAHMPNPPRAVRWMQDCGILLSRAAYRDHIATPTQGTTAS